MTTPAFTAPWALLPWQAAQLASYALLPAAIDSGVAATGFFSAAALGFRGSCVETARPRRRMANTGRAALADYRRSVHVHENPCFASGSDPMRPRVTDKSNRTVLSLFSGEIAMGL